MGVFVGRPGSSFPEQNLYAGKHRSVAYFKGNVALAGRLASVLSNQTKTVREVSR